MGDRENRKEIARIFQMRINVSLNKGCYGQTR
jgi:hypothetical protein